MVSTMLGYIIKNISSFTSHQKLSHYGILAFFFLAHSFITRLVMLTLRRRDFLLHEVLPQRSLRS